MWEVDRENLFRTEITKMFLAYNKPVNKNLIEAKTELTAEVLKTLKTKYIQAFFEYVRQTEESLPTDGALKKILVSNIHKFSDVEKTLQIEYRGEFPSEEWRSQFHIEVKKVIAGTSSPEEAKERLGI